MGALNIAAIAISIVTLLVTVIAAAAGNQLATEFRAWSPSLVERLLRRAVRRAPAEMQERLEEEWRAFLSETPGHLCQLVQAYGLGRAASRISRDGSPVGKSRLIEKLLSRAFGVVAFVTLLVNTPTFALAFLVRPTRSLTYFKGLKPMLRFMWSMVRGEVVVSLDEWREAGSRLTIAVILGVRASDLIGRLARLFNRH
jgi:hypothetical protein